MTAIIVIFFVLVFLWLALMWRDITNATRKQWEIISDYEKWIGWEHAARERADALVKDLCRDNERLRDLWRHEFENHGELREDLARCDVEKTFYYEEIRRLYRKYEA